MFCSKCGNEIDVDLRMSFCPKCGVEFDDTMRKAIKKNIRGDEPKQFESYRNKTFQGERVGVYDLDMDEEWGKLSNSDINIDFNKVKVWFGRAVLTFIAIISIACVSKAFVCANCGEIHLTRYRYENFSDEKEYLCHDCAERYYVFLDVERFRE